MMKRFDGYNRSDYYTPRTSREAFGMQARGEDFLTDSKVVFDKVHWGDVAVVCLCLVVSVYIIFFGWGV